MGSTFIRESDINTDYLTKQRGQVRRPDRVLAAARPARPSTPTGTNVPDYLEAGGPALVEERGHGGDGRDEPAQAAAGQPGRGDGSGDGIGSSAPA